MTGEQFAQISSQDMDELLWRGLANRINKLFESDAADGIVVTHGTDTAEETGYFLHLTVTSERPVVLTGSMRPATSLSADGPLNLYNAVSVAADRDARNRGVMLAINDDLHSARDVTKSSTTDVQTFVLARPGIVGHGATRAAFDTSVVRCDGIRLSRAFRPMLSVACPEWIFCTRTPACTPDLVRSSVSLGARGIVVAGVGNGNVPGPVVNSLAEAAEVGRDRGSAPLASAAAMSSEVRARR